MSGVWTRRRLLLSGAGALLAGAGTRRAAAHSYTAHHVFIGHIWSPPGTGGDVPVYGPLLNRGEKPDWLIGAECGQAREVRFERAENGKTTRIEKIALPPGKPVTLAPWSIHLVLAGMEGPVATGARIPLTLVFRHAGKVPVESLVEAEPGH